MDGGYKATAFVDFIERNRSKAHAPTNHRVYDPRLSGNDRGDCAGVRHDHWRSLRQEGDQEDLSASKLGQLIVVALSMKSTSGVKNCLVRRIS